MTPMKNHTKTVVTQNLTPRQQAQRRHDLGEEFVEACNKSKYNPHDEMFRAVVIWLMIVLCIGTALLIAVVVTDISIGIALLSPDNPAVSSRGVR